MCVTGLLACCCIVGSVQSLQCKAEHSAGLVQQESAEMLAPAAKRFLGMGYKLRCFRVTFLLPQQTAPTVNVTLRNCFSLCNILCLCTEVVPGQRKHLHLVLILMQVQEGHYTLEQPSSSSHISNTSSQPQHCWGSLTCKADCQHRSEVSLTSQAYIALLSVLLCLVQHGTYHTDLTCS